MAVSYTDKYDVFISYRTEGGESMATLLHERLTEKGFKVFLDIESLNSGSFNKKLLAVIENCNDMVVICSKNSFDRCINEGDWVRMEIAHAFKHDKNVVPIMLRGFSFPENLPEDIEEIQVQNRIDANNIEYFDAAIERLIKSFLVSKPSKNTFEPPKWLLPCAVSVLITAVLIIGLFMLLGGDDSGDFVESPAIGDIAGEAAQVPGISDDTSEAIPPVGESSQNENRAGFVSNISPADEYVFIEPLIEQAVRLMLDMEENEPVIYGDLEWVREVGIIGMYPTTVHDFWLEYEEQSQSFGTIANLEDLRHMKNLRVIQLINQPISDLSPLAELPDLHSLLLFDSSVTDWSVIEKMNKLENLYITGSEIKSISELGENLSIRFLELSNTNLENLDGIHNMPLLEQLAINSTLVRDFSLLNDADALPHLHWLVISFEMGRSARATLTRGDIEVVFKD
ncbi:MAG: TIR domain-containing protein [Lachnospiraceae bacterium]|nr:TIR domain-containing protein [Lachnospiraceae bacterium]